jgi:gamma-glutamyl-gamma-aminobutyrate hydrolase PuuD
MPQLRPKTNQQSLVAISVNAETYSEWVVRSGGNFRLVTSQGKELHDGITGLLLTGGEDVSPGMYGEVNRHCERVNPERDKFELELLYTALDRSWPVLAVCRGMQLLVAALGGKLYQDLSELVPGLPDQKAVCHRAPRHTDVTHLIGIEAETLLARVIGRPTLTVNSHHHQAIRELPRDLRAAAYSADGSIEAVEYTRNRFVLGVQWHPERWAHESSDALMRAFLSTHGRLGWSKSAPSV